MTLLVERIGPEAFARTLFRVGADQRLCGRVRIDAVEVRAAHGRVVLLNRVGAGEVFGRRDVGHMAGHAGDLLMRIGLRKDGFLRFMAVTAFFLHFRGRHGRHPVGAAHALLIVAGHAGKPFFIVLREGVLLGFFVEDLGEFNLDFFLCLRPLVARGVELERINKGLMLGQIKLHGRIGVGRLFRRLCGAGEKDRAGKGAGRENTGVHLGNPFHIVRADRNLGSARRPHEALESCKAALGGPPEMRRAPQGLITWSTSRYCARKSA